MLHGCGAHLLRCLQQGDALVLGFADEFTRASDPHIHEDAPVRFALLLASELPHSSNTRLLRRVLNIRVGCDCHRSLANRKSSEFW